MTSSRPSRPAVVAAFSAALLLASCAAGGGSGESAATAMSRGQCANADWRRLGRDDGARGAPEIILAGYVRTCSGHGEPPDQDAWRAGWAAGRAASGG